VGHDLVHLTTASSQTEAGALRAYLEAHGIYVHVQGEHHSSLLGPLGPFAIELRILVPEPDAASARELLEAYYAAEPVDDEVALSAADPEDGEDEVIAPAPGPSTSPAAAAAIAIVPGFGLGHVVTGAAGRGIALMALEVLGIAWILGGEVTQGVAAVLAAITLDVVGARKRARERADAAVAPARLHRGESS
jgi:hypothetical protein